MELQIDPFLEPQRPDLLNISRPRAEREAV
jgi:hypothetical protein